VKSPKNIYVVTRTHGLRPHLLKSEDYVRILRSKNLTEISDILFKSDYAPELSRISARELDAFQLEKIFYQKLSERFAFLFQITSGSLREALEGYYRKIEVENLKRIIKAKHGKEKISEDELIPVPRRYQSVNFPALLETESIAEMVELLKESPYRGLKNATDLYEKYGSPLVLNAQADKIYYTSLWQKLGGIVDRTEVKELIGTEVDLNNLLYMFSFKRMKTDPSVLARMIIDVRYKLPRSLIPKLIDAPYERIPSLLTWPAYAELARKAVELLDKELLAETEHIFSQHLYSYAGNMILRNPNSLVFVFAYLTLCFKEAKNLTALSLGKQLKLSDEKIQSLLFL